MLVIGSGCAGSSILNTCMPNVVAGQAGRQNTYGKTASGAKVNWDTSSANYIGNVGYINPAAFTVTVAGTCKTDGSVGSYQTMNGQAYNVCGGPADYVPGNACGAVEPVGAGQAQSRYVPEADLPDLS